jgi:hypothetical protein
VSLKALNLQWLHSSKLIFILQSTWEALTRQENPPTYILGSFHKLKSTEFAMASFLKMDVHCAKCLGGSLKATNLPPTYILGSFCKLKSTKLQWLHSSKLMSILQSTRCPRTIIVGSSFQECGIEIPCITLQIVDHIVVLCVVCQAVTKSQKLCHHKHVLLGIHAICKAAPSAMNIQTIISYCSEIQQHFVFLVGYI